MVFYTDDPVFCPKCPPQFRKRPLPIQVGVALNCIEQNYSGCSVDIGQCPVCGGVFEVSYKVDRIQERKPSSADENRS